jgi:cell wall-associated NlpC family hydrolase
VVFGVPRRGRAVAAVSVAASLWAAGPASAAGGPPPPTPGAFWQGVPVIHAAGLAPSHAPASAGLATAFWARPQVQWAVSQGWVSKAGPKNFGPATLVHRLGAAKVLALAYQRWKGTAVWSDPYREAVTLGWIPAGGGPSDTMTQHGFDSGVVNMLGLHATAVTYSTLHEANGRRVPLPLGFAAEQIVRHLGIRVNAPAGDDTWEWWPRDRMVRAELAIEAYGLAHLPGWTAAWATSQAAVAGGLPTWTPLQRQVLRFAIRYAGAPYVWGGTSDRPQRLFGRAAAGGFDCSGFVWWVLKLHRFRLANGRPWSAAIAGRTTYQMARALPVSKRLGYGRLRPGDVLFWSDKPPHGAATHWQHIYHTGIYLGQGWTIDSHGAGDGVTIDRMSPGSGWFHDYFAFGWRVLPRGR